jgi:glycogen debranching enzyme
VGKPTQDYEMLALCVQQGFSRFWNPDASYCYDVLDTPDGNDPTLRPNQLFAVALPHSPLDTHQQRAVVDVCTANLVTSHGLRSLAQVHPDYKGRYGGDSFQRDSAYHQGTVWSWLMGAFVSAHLRVYRDTDLALSYLMQLVRQLESHGLGSISEIFDGDPPFTPRGCFAQAWSVAEVLRAWHAIMERKEEQAAKKPRKR